MTDIMALDIETGNYSYEIGGWDKTALFEPTVVATWDGTDGNVYCNKALDIDATVKELHPRTLGDDLTAFIAKGGRILGHNIKGFDLPVLRDALDCWTAGDLLGKADSVLDTKNLFQKAVTLMGGVKCDTTLNTLVKSTLGGEKLMQSHDAPLAWRNGQFDDVAKYCLSDAQLTYDLYKHGLDEGFVKSRCLETGAIIEVDVEW
tara:strand:+ start:5121 stop:5732 length:612 start_codon:yes stop_codon:yes gene_type:complete